MVKHITSEKELVKIYKCLDKVDNTNLPKLKSFIKSTIYADVYGLYINKKLIGALYIQDMGTHISLTNIYIIETERYKKYIFELYRQVLYYKRSHNNKRVFALIYNNLGEYGKMVKHIEDDLYEIIFPEED